MKPDYRGFVVATAASQKRISEDSSVPQFKMATVTSVSPLRVRFDNELSASAATPRNLIGVLAVGDRVRVTLHRGKTAIDGRVGIEAPQAVLALGSGANLNTLLEWRVYTQASNAGAASGSNYPVELAGALEVIPIAGGAGAMIWQRYTTYRHTALFGGEEIGPAVYVRAFYNAIWSPWICVGGEPRIAGVQSAKTYYEKYPDGRLICRGSHGWSASTGTQSYEWSFPVAFVGEFPHITVTEDTTVPQNVNASISGLSLTGVNIWHYRSTAVANTSRFQAEGRWK